MKKQDTITWYYDNEDEFEEAIHELESNPDFHFIDSYDLIQDIYDELNYQGLTDHEIEQLLDNRYGNCIEILKSANSQYYVYIGAR